MKTFLELKKINVNEHTEKKGKLTYLSWAWAVDKLLEEDSSATWSYAEPKMFGDTMMVFCTVTAFCKSMTAHLPVMNHLNKSISNPDSMAVNTAMQRCLAKAIALHGIGLYIYAGEDLPEPDDIDVTDYVTKITEAETMEVLRDVYLAGAKFCKGDQKAEKVLLDAKDAKKKALEVA